MARTEAAKIVAAAKADIQKDLDAATAKADAEISAKAAESEKKIAEIRAGALEAVDAVAKDTAEELVAASGRQGGCQGGHRGGLRPAEGVRR
jgi:F-type H+-transporting ATPase subunit b